MNTPSLGDDGAHVIPVSQPCYAGCEPHPDATGSLRWHPEKGVTLSVDLPGVSSAELPRYFKRQPSASGTGRFQARCQTPHWTARTAEGLALSVIEINATPTSTFEYGSQGIRAFSSVNVEAGYACVDLTRDNPLSFWHQTPEQSRMLCLGFGSGAWQTIENISYEHEGGTTTTGRGSITLSDAPLIRLFAGWRMKLPEDIAACWLVSEQGSTGLEYPLQSERGFISFLNGRRTPFFWHDAFVNDRQLKRTYYGWPQVRIGDLTTSYSQPLPLYGTVESLLHASEVVKALPALMGEFVGQPDSMRITWILNPLWMAATSVLDDRFALACVSLERLAAAWKQIGDQKNQQQQFNDEQIAMGQAILLQSLDTASPTLKLDEVQKRILRQRIKHSLFQPSNSNKLSSVFFDQRITLTSEEKSTIEKRNIPLHGRATLRDASDLVELNDEGQRFDCLRVLITKAILSLLKYRGPFINYAARPKRGNFPVERL